MTATLEHLTDDQLTAIEEVTETLRRVVDRYLRHDTLGAASDRFTIEVTTEAWAGSAVDTLNFDAGWNACTTYLMRTFSRLADRQTCGVYEVHFH